ncbi:hypothetical protein AMTRI_Chr05g73050 [Amborella trichopoda]
MVHAPSIILMNHLRSLTPQVHIVYMGEKQHEALNVVRDLHYDILATLHGRSARESMVYSYRYGFSGFAARLTENQAKILSG